MTCVFRAEVPGESDHVAEPAGALRHRSRESRPFDGHGRRTYASALASENAAKVSSDLASDRNAKPAARRTATYDATAGANMAAPLATAGQSDGVR